MLDAGAVLDNGSVLDAGAVLGAQHRLMAAAPDLVGACAGKQTDRKTLLGELNWIFTAITDTIAWNMLPRSLFQKLFRQDLLVASLFRNFMLAERIMLSCGCLPVSHPRLMPMHQHPMWEAWDMTAESSLLQLSTVINDETRFKPSSFFSEQLTAFELWLSHGSTCRDPPEQLPVVLQVRLDLRSSSCKYMLQRFAVFRLQQQQQQRRDCFDGAAVSWCHHGACCGPPGTMRVHCVLPHAHAGSSRCQKPPQGCSMRCIALSSTVISQVATERPGPPVVRLGLTQSVGIGCRLGTRRKAAQLELHSRSSPLC